MRFPSDYTQIGLNPSSLQWREPVNRRTPSGQVCAIKGDNYDPTSVSAWTSFKWNNFYSARRTRLRNVRYCDGYWRALTGQLYWWFHAHDGLTPPKQSVIFSGCFYKISKGFDIVSFFPIIWSTSLPQFKVSRAGYFWTVLLQQTKHAYGTKPQLRLCVLQVLRNRQIITYNAPL